MIPQHIKDNLPPEVKQALAVFTEEEQNNLTLIIAYETNTFEGVGFIDRDKKKIYKPANIEKYKALQVLETHIRNELKKGE